MTQEADRPNFFIILDLDPDARWDPAAFERSLAEHRSTWSRLRNSGIKTHPNTVLARWCLSHFKDIERVMRDPGLRRQEQAAARQVRVDDQRRQLDEFVEKLDLMLTKGFLYDIESKTLKADAIGVAGADAALRQRLAGVDVRSFERVRAGQERLDPTSERVIKANLAILAESSLYTALARVDRTITEASPRDKLLKAAADLYRKALNTADKTKPQVGAMEQLAGQAKRVFSDDDLTRRYKFSMLVAPLEELAERYKKNLESVRMVDASQAERFLRAAAEKRIDPDLAREFLISYFSELHWTVELPGPATGRELKRLVACPRCETLNEPDAPSCRNCGRVMREACPRCGLDVSAGARVCPQCNFPTGERDWAEYLVEEAESALGREDIDGATENVVRAEHAWPAAADSTNDLAVRIRSAREGITRLEAARGQQAKHIAALMQDDQYRTALLRLRGLSVRLPAAAELIAECERKVAQAHELCRAAERPGTSNDRKAELFLQALRICKDYEPARQGLESIPPEPPHDLQVVVDDKRRVVQLAWEQNSAAGCGWVVVRAEGIDAPISAADLPGQKASRGVSSLTWTDPDPMIGAPVRYAVYAQRGAVLSARAAVAPEVVFLTMPCELTAKAADRAIELNWTIPPNAEGVELQREEVGSSAPIYLSVERGQSHLVDKKLKNGARYRYTIRARFADPTVGQPGAVRYAPAAAAEAIPSRPPEPLPAPHAQGGPPPPGMRLYDHKVVLRWSAPERGVIKILRAAPDVALRPGDDLTEEQLARHGYLPKDPPRPFTDTLRGFGPFVQYFLVLSVDGRCHVGHPRRYLASAEVRDLTAEYMGNSVRLRWTWPELGDEALVAWDEHAEIPDALAGPMQERIPRSQGETTGGFDISVDTTAKLFVLVAVVAHAHGVEFVSSGTPITVPRPSVALRYQIRPSGRRSELVLKPERPTWLPALELHGRADNRPVGRNDPVLLELPPSQSEGELVKKFALGSALPRSCRLFVADDSDDYGVRIIHP